MANDEMTSEQRQELKHLCDKADVPDKSGELLSKAEAQRFIDDLKKQIAERGA
jgi:polyhydroxyalkanoate synthesis regulator phasin